MTGREIAKQILETRKGEQYFIKWWRKENDFIDFELIDTFIKNARTEEEFTGYELLSMEQLWEIARSLDPDRLSRQTTEGQESIAWQQKRDDGTTVDRVCPFTPDSLISIVDVLTKGNYVD